MNTNSVSKAAHSSPPIALSGVYETAEPNRPVVLYEKEMDVTANEVTSRVCGRIDLVWQPSKSVTFEFEVPPFTDWPGEVTVTTVEGSIVGVGPISTTTVGWDDDKGVHPTVVQGKFNRVTHPPTSDLSHVIFHLANFAFYLGDRIRYSEQHSGAGRVILECEDWRVTLDQLGGDWKQKMRSTSGYIFTHVGKVERLDGATFSSKDVLSVLEVLGLLFSFAKGRHTHPMLSVGFRSDGQRLWEDWTSWKQASWKKPNNWFPRNRPQALGKIFPVLARVQKEAIWYEPLKLAIMWNVHAYDEGPIQSAILQAQVGLEMIAWMEIVEKQGVSSSRFDPLAAHEKFSEFFLWAGIPIDIPPDFTALQSLAADTTNKMTAWEDGPRAVAGYRNGIVHPKRREVCYGASVEAQWEVQKLCLWYLELSILRVLDYRDRYAPSIRNNLMEGYEEWVPWAVPLANPT